MSYTIGLDIPSYAELSALYHNAVRREQAAKRKLARARHELVLARRIRDARARPAPSTTGGAK